MEASPIFAVLCFGAVLSFAVAFMVATRPGFAARRPRGVILLAIWQGLVATFVASDLAYVLALMLPFLYSRRAALTWLVAFNLIRLPYLVYFIVAIRSPEPGPWGMVAVELGIHAVWQCFSFAIGMTAAIERDGRAELARLNAQLVAAQSLVADRTRLAERLAISRDLHDSLGHHLAALTVQLEVARHHATGPALEAVAQAQATGRQLLGELREVVSAWRDDAVDLRVALHDLAAAIDTPAITVRVADDLSFAPEVARTLYRCAQELVTNSVRHAGAGHVWLELQPSGGGLSLTATDDGRAAHSVVPGNGLRGIAERADALRGRVDIRSRPGEPVRVEVWLPAGSAGP